MKGNVNYLELANSPLMWVSAAIAVGIVVFQSVLFFRKSPKQQKRLELNRKRSIWQLRVVPFSFNWTIYCNPGNNDLPDRINGSTCFMDETFFHRIR